MKRLCKYSTRAGNFYIAQLIDDLVCNATFSVLHPNSGAIIDTSELGIANTPAEWERV